VSAKANPGSAEGNCRGSLMKRNTKSVAPDQLVGGAGCIGCIGVADHPAQISGHSFQSTRDNLQFFVLNGTADHQFVNYGPYGGIVSTPSGFLKVTQRRLRRPNFSNYLSLRWLRAVFPKTHQSTFFPGCTTKQIDDARFLQTTTQLSIRHDGR
jgi:hypothetical protein